MKPSRVRPRVVLLLGAVLPAAALWGCNVSPEGRGLSFASLLQGKPSTFVASPEPGASNGGASPTGGSGGGEDAGGGGPGTSAPTGPLYLAPTPPPVALAPGALGLSSLDRYVVAPGMSLVVRGQGFGNGEKPVQALFGATFATEITRESDTAVRLRVPAGLTSGDLSLLVGGVRTNSLPYRVLRELRMSGPDELLLGKVTVFRVQGTDTENRVIEDPPVDWSVDGSGLSQAWGQATAVGVEGARMVASSGDLTVLRSVHVFRVDGILLDRGALDLVAPAGPGQQPDAGFLTRQAVTARVLASDEQTAPRDVTWTVEDVSVASVASATKTPGARATAEIQAAVLSEERRTVLRAVSVDDPRVVATASIRVRPESGLDVVVD